MIKIGYIDNSGKEREYIVKTLSWGDAVKELEHNANEIGHGIKVIVFGVMDRDWETILIIFICL